MGADGQQDARRDDEQVDAGADPSDRVAAFGIELGDDTATIALVDRSNEIAYLNARTLPVDIAPLAGLESDDDGHPSPRAMARAAVLARLRGVLYDADASGNHVGSAVIAVPAMFANAGRDGLREAAVACGVRVLDLLDAPVAAALTELTAIGAGAAQRVFVVELGVLSIGVAALRMGAQEVRVEAIGGRLEVERSDADSWFDALAEAVQDTATRALAADPGPFDRLLVCGTGSRDPDVVDVVERALGEVVTHRTVRENAVAIGAAIGAAMLGRAVPMPIRRVASRGIGFVVDESDVDVELDDGIDHTVVTFAVHRDDPLPRRVTEVFATTIDHQLAVEIVVAEQRSAIESAVIADNVVAAEGCVFPLPADCPAGSEVEVVLEVGEDGIYSLSVGSVRRPGEVVAESTADPDVPARLESAVRPVITTGADATALVPTSAQAERPFFAVPGLLRAEVEQGLVGSIDNLLFVLGDVPELERRALVAQARRDGLSVEHAEELVAIVLDERRLALRRTGRQEFDKS